MDIMKVYTAGTMERTRLVAAKEMLAAYSADDFVIREVEKGKDTYCRSLDSKFNKDKWTTIMRRRRAKKETLYHTCLTPKQQERLLTGSVGDALLVLKEVIES